MSAVTAKSVREQAIEAAISALFEQEGSSISWWQSAEVAVGVALAAAVPVLLSDLADQIAARANRWRIDERPNHWADGVDSAAEIVRSAAEGWGQ